jgi:Tol biopolymer transport system component
VVVTVIVAARAAGASAHVTVAVAAIAEQIVRKGLTKLAPVAHYTSARARSHLRGRLDLRAPSHEDAVLMRRWLALAVLVLAAGAPTARAVTLGGTALIDRPSGFGPLPFDGIASSFAAPHSVTPDGRYVVFSSASNVLLAGDEDTATNVYRLDLTTGALLQVDTTSSGGQPTPGSSNERASISADGVHVGFITNSPALDPAASSESQQFVVKNLTTGAVELASRANGSAGAAVVALEFAVLSGDGRHVAFTAASAVQADNATGLTTTVDAYERSLDTNTTHMVSVTSGGAEAGGVRDAPDIDFSGDTVAFVTQSALVAGDTDTGDDAYIYKANAPLLASFSGGGQAAGADTAFDVAVAGVSAIVEVAWSNGGNEWVSPCVATCETPASQADHARTGGKDFGENEAPFFPPQTKTGFPFRVYWNSREPLDPTDTNDTIDLYGWDIGNNTFDTSIHLMTSGQDNRGAFGAAATEDGGVTVFSSNSAGLPGSDATAEQAFVRKAGVNTNISQPFGQAPRVDEAGFGFISPLHATSDNGGQVGFASQAPALGSPLLSTGPPTQALLRDVTTGTTRLISAAPDGVTAGDGSSNPPSVDAAGDRVAFQSSASNLVPGDTNKQPDVFVRDLSTGVTTLVDRTAGGGFPVDGANSPQISADGRKVVYVSNSPDIPGAPPGTDRHIYEADLATGNVTLVDRAGSGAVADTSSSQPDIDGDGGRVAFLSSASNLGGGTLSSLYVRDLATSTTTWASMPQDGLPAHDTAQSASIDRDGVRVAWTETNPAFGFGMTAGSEQVFVRDLAGQTTTLASIGASGAANLDAFRPSLAADGSRLSFSSSATNLPGATPGYTEVFVRDLAAGTTVLGATVDGAASGGRFGADVGSLSGNGDCVAFESTSDDLLAGGYGSDFEHVFLHALGGACPAASSSGPPAAPPAAPLDKTPPAIGNFTVTHKRFAVGAKPTAVSAAKKAKQKRPVRGTSFNFTLSEAATIHIAITRKMPGHRSRAGRPCAIARRGQKHNCSRTLTLLTLVRAHSAAGANAVAFSGRFSKSRLAKGSYTATITATDAANNHSTPRSVAFSVIG